MNFIPIELPAARVAASGEVLEFFDAAVGIVFSGDAFVNRDSYVHIHSICGDGLRVTHCPQGESQNPHPFDFALGRLGGGSFRVSPPGFDSGLHLAS